MAAQGLPKFATTQSVQPHGLTNVLLNLPKLMQAISNGKAGCRGAAPDAVIGIDAQDYVGQIMQGVVAEHTAHTTGGADGLGETSRTRPRSQAIWIACFVYTPLSPLCLKSMV